MEGSGEQVVESEVPLDSEPGWKLAKERLPEGWLDEDAYWENWKRIRPAQLRDNFYLDFLLNRDKGLFGDRPGNRWRLGIRRFIERFVVIQDKMTLKMGPFRLNEAQRILLAKIIRRMRRGQPVRVWILKARQQGASTFVAALILYLMVTRPYTRTILMGHKKDSAAVIAGRVTHMIDGLRRKNGKRWRLVVETNNRKEIVLAAPQNSTAIIESAEGPDYRGDTLRAAHIIEPGDWPNAEAKANALMQAIPDAEDTVVVIEGTARGDANWFARGWKAAWQRTRDDADGATEFACFFPWFLHQNYRWSVVNRRELSERAQKEIEATLTEEEQALLGMSYTRRGVGSVKVDYDQLAWRRYAIDAKCQGSLDLFHQEYPATWSEAFLSSGMRFFSPKAIARSRAETAGPPTWRGDLVDESGEALMRLRLEELEELSA